MKKLYNLKEKNLRKNRSLKIERRKREKNLKERKRKTKFLEHQKLLKRSSFLPYLEYAPADFRLLGDNTERVLEFFRAIRREDNIIYYHSQKSKFISMIDVVQIDYAAVSILQSISDYFDSKNVNLSGDFPKDRRCEKFLWDSGFLDRMYDLDNKPYGKNSKSQNFVFQHGSGKQTKEQRIEISKAVKDVVHHLTGNFKNVRSVKTAINEILANSIEHGKVEGGQWRLGIMYENDHVTFTVSDVGKGILGTLYNKFKTRFKDFFLSSRVDVLNRAFITKYEETNSSTQETNRNKGLPSIKSNFDKGIIKNLIVLTNDVILHFDTPEKSHVLKAGSARFKGTLYQWVMNKECVINSIQLNDEEI